VSGRDDVSLGVLRSPRPDNQSAFVLGRLYVMKFRLTADATFEAEDLDDAFAKLAEHFRRLSDAGSDGPEIITSGKISIRGEGTGSSDA
jgi:hypothetical protein